jgi:hypothetical protein
MFKETLVVVENPANRDEVREFIKVYGPLFEYTKVFDRLFASIFDDDRGHEDILMDILTRAMLKTRIGNFYFAIDWDTFQILRVHEDNWSAYNKKF